MAGVLREIGYGRTQYDGDGLRGLEPDGGLYPLSRYYFLGPPSIFAFFTSETFPSVHDLFYPGP